MNATQGVISILKIKSNFTQLCKYTHFRLNSQKLTPQF